MKTCPVCKQEKQDSEFSINRRRKDGLNVMCRECDSERQRKWRKENPYKASEYNRRSYQKHRDKRRAAAKAYYESHKEECKARAKRTREENADMYRYYAKRYRVMRALKELRS